MIEKRTNLQWYLVLVFIKLLGAQEVRNTSSNQASSPSALQPTFSDVGAMGFPNFGSGRFGSPTNTLNYPTNSFFPYGNQNNNLQQPHQGPGLSYPNQGNFQNRPQDYPNQQGHPNVQGYPYQGDSRNQNPNYQRPQYPNENIQNRPVQGEYPNQNAFPYQGDSNTRYPNYQQPSYPNSQGYGSAMYPADISRPYQNGGMPTNQGGPGQSFQYPPQDKQYPSQRNFPVTGNPNFRPDDLGKLPGRNINLPDVPNQYQPNQYYPQMNFPNYPYNNPNSNIHVPTNYGGGANVYPPANQYPNQGMPNPG